MKHFTLRYSILTQEPIEAELPDCCHAVIDHQTGDTVERWLTFEEAQDLIDDLTGENTKPEPQDEYPAHERAASRADELYDRNREGW